MCVVFVELQNGPDKKKESEYATHKVEHTVANAYKHKHALTRPKQNMTTSSNNNNDNKRERSEKKRREQNDSLFNCLLLDFICWCG